MKLEAVDYIGNIPTKTKDLFVFLEIEVDESKSCIIYFGSLVVCTKT